MQRLQCDNLSIQWDTLAMQRPGLALQRGKLALQSLRLPVQGGKLVVQRPRLALQGRRLPVQTASLPPKTREPARSWGKTGGASEPAVKAGPRRARAAHGTAGAGWSPACGMAWLKISFFGPTADFLQKMKICPS